MQHLSASKTVLFILFFDILLSSPAWAGKIYKWVDESGITQFSTYPPITQKPDRPVTAVKGISASTRPANLSCHELCGVWLYIEHRTVNRLTITKDSYNYQPESRHGMWGQAKGGGWVLTGDTLEVTYTMHHDKSKKGTKEQFFVKMPDPETLTLIPINGGKRVSFRQEHDFSNPDGLRSGLEQEFIGSWKSVRGMDGDNLNLTHKKFIISGEITKRSGNYASRTTGTKYQGLWRVDDPHIRLDITADEMFDSERRKSLVGQQWHWVIIKKTVNTLEVRDTATRRLLKFIKTGD